MQCREILSGLQHQGYSLARRNARPRRVRRLRPAPDPPAQPARLQASCFIATARCDGRLVGLLRLIGDGAYILHIADLMVHPSQQGRGVGRRLVQLAIDYAVREGIGVGDGLGEFTLFAATGAEGFYRKLQFASLPNGMFYADCEERVQAAAETRQHWRSSTEGNQP